MPEALAVDIRGDDFQPNYEMLWRRADRNAFFRSPAHLRMICGLTDSELMFVVAEGEEGPIAVLPIAAKAGRYGAVINALPFYGTCSAIIGDASPTTRDRMQGALQSHAKAKGAAALTLVDDWRAKTFEGLQGATYVTERTNQFIDLTGLRGRDPMDSYHQKTRNLVRKAAKLGVAVRRSWTEADLDGLEASHRDNMAGVGGIAKPAAFFELLRDPSRPLGDATLHVASLDGQDCAYLLNFRCGDTIEYYMPTVLASHRGSQPLSLLIHTAIGEAVADGFGVWNFGGTWPTQDSLRHFKTRWGGEETRYAYFTYLFDDRILDVPRDTIAAEYPYFFVAPFEHFRDCTPRGAA